MDDVRAGGLNPDHLVDRHHHLVIDPEQPGLLVLGQQRIELEFAVVGIGVAPVPLLAGGLDCQVGLGNVELLKQQPERRHRDADQDQHRNQRPGHLDQGVVGGPGGHRVGLGVELDDNDDQQRQNEQRDDGDQHQQEIVKPGDVVHHRRARFLQCPFPRRRLPQFGECRPAGGQRNAGHRKSQQSPARLALRHLHAARAPLIEPQSTPPDGQKCCTIRPLTNGRGWYFRSTRARSLECVEIQPLKP